MSNTEQQDQGGRTEKAAAPNQPRVHEQAAQDAIPLGSRVRFARRVDRVESDRGHSWRIVPDSPGEGVFTGYRYKQNGVWDDESEWERGDRNYVWCEKGRVKVALVVREAWSNPWTVDPEGLEVLTTEGT